jgi:hypothetical protein
MKVQPYYQNISIQTHTFKNFVFNVSPTKILNELVLIFTDNQIGDQGATALSEYLKSNSTLQQLNLVGKSHLIYIYVLPMQVTK